MDELTPEEQGERLVSSGNEMETYRVSEILDDTEGGIRDRDMKETDCHPDTYEKQNPEVS